MGSPTRISLAYIVGDVFFWETCIEIHKSYKTVSSSILMDGKWLLALHSTTLQLYQL